MSVAATFHFAREMGRTVLAERSIVSRIGSIVVVALMITSKCVVAVTRRVVKRLCLP